MPEPLKPVTPLVLAGEQYLLAKNEKYFLLRPLPEDPLGVVAHEHIAGLDDSGLTHLEIHALLQLLGTYIERCHSLEAAVQKGAP